MDDREKSNLHLNMERSRIDQNSDNRGVIAANTHHGTFIGTQNNHYTNPPTTAEIERLRKEISSLDFSGTHEQFYDAVTPGTGQWFLDSEQFQLWMSKKTQNLWCFGKPGAGKSLLASIVVEKLRRKNNCKVAFVYLSYKEKYGQEHSIRDLLGCLASQLIGQLSELSLPPCVQRLLEGKVSPQLGLSKLEELLSELGSSGTSFVIDALDEYTSNHLGDLLNHLCQTKVNLFVTSRHHAMKGFTEIEIGAKEYDIHNYIQQKCDRSERLAKMTERDKSLQQEIKEEITKKAAGIFLLARFHIEAVLESLRATEVRNVLKRLPDSHDSMYKSTVNRIQAQGKTRSDCAFRTIGWILHAFEPLRFEQLRHALLIQEMQESNGHQSNDPETGNQEPAIFFDHGRLFQETDILAFSYGLVEVDKETETMRFTHFTTREYFDRARDELFPSYHSRISLSCATYLCLSRLEERENAQDMDRSHDAPENFREEFNEFVSIRESSSKLECDYPRCLRHRKLSFPIVGYPDGSGPITRLPYYLKLLLYPLVIYIARNMGKHVIVTTDKLSRSAIDNQLRILLESFPKRLLYAKLLEDRLEPYRGTHLMGGLERANLQPSALHCAAHAGSAFLVDRFFHQGYEINARDYRGLTALSIAIFNGSSDIVKTCLSLGAMSDLTNSAVYHALVSACLLHNDEALKILITSMNDAWKKQSGQKETTLPISGMPAFQRILHCIANNLLFNSFEDATEDTGKIDMDYASAGEFNLDDYFLLFDACRKGDAAAILGLIESGNVSLKTQPTEEEDSMVSKVWTGFISTSAFLCKSKENEEMDRILSDHADPRFSDEKFLEGFFQMRE
ncbi:hypothetical protein IWZ00DRAFT_489585 [Phyllosticta capitalensis]